MAGTGDYNYDDILTDISVSFTNVSEGMLDEFTVKEIMLGESLLTPGLQTSIKAHSYIHTVPSKNFDLLKKSDANIILQRRVLEKYGFPADMNIQQKVYRLDNRKLINNNTEELTIRCCDQSMLNDAKTLVSKSWKCTSPTSIVNYALRSCAGVRRLSTLSSGPARDYIAENIHPFQVVAQQANYALDGDDPSFLHYMTYENGGTHHFKSLKYLTRQKPVARFIFNDTGESYPLPNSIMTYSFPCDFDLLSDALNGIDENGQNMGSITLFNPHSKTFSLLGNQEYGCGIGAGVIKAAITNQNSAKQQDSCPDYAKTYLLKRQARMGLLEQDKIALKLTVPFNTVLHAGKVISIDLYNKEANNKNTEVYGSGDYLILHMFHHIIEGGFSVTTMSCVSTTVGRGEV
jgi:hypothetical protein